MTEPGQPCVMISGIAAGCGDFTWMKWMATPSISVVNCGSVSVCVHLRQSCSVAQYRASSRIVAESSPCDLSATSSLLGQSVAAMRSRSALSSVSQLWIVKGRTAFVRADCSDASRHVVLLGLMVEMDGSGDDLRTSSLLVLRAGSHFECAVAPGKITGSPAVNVKPIKPGRVSASPCSVPAWNWGSSPIRLSHGARLPSACPVYSGDGPHVVVDKEAGQ